MLERHGVYMYKDMPCTIRHFAVSIFAIAGWEVLSVIDKIHRYNNGTCSWPSIFSRMVLVTPRKADPSPCVVHLRVDGGKQKMYTAFLIMPIEQEHEPRHWPKAG